MKLLRLELYRTTCLSCFLASSCVGRWTRKRSKVTFLLLELGRLELGSIGSKLDGKDRQKGENS